ncbi:MAG: GtrA family protein [Spirochaetia bacterium]|jgi:putative flippase GtrA|nr:GtrA family protein [Acholeplasmataceae bacterium]MDD4194081.1 GtrA family protein [Acholeplasmataceae bacterium]MDY0339335.1 GtrA family protein [Acholeplasmataceae bacterium]NCD07794.1 GtrA family protein [Spirochaetia bacterium]
MDRSKQTRDNYLQMIKFTLFSLSAGIIQILSFTFLFEVIGFIYWPSYLVALTLSVLWNFTLNRKFTFKSASNIPIAMSKIAFFYLVFTPLSTWWGDALTKLNYNEYLILAVTMVSNLILEFLYTKYYVYRHSINTAIKN